MSTSGVFSFDPTRTQIIEAALQRIGVLGAGQSASSDQLTQGSFWLNLLVKSMQNDGVRLWTEEWETQTLTASSEVIGSDGLNYECIRPHTSDATNKPVTGADYTTYWTQRGTSGGTWVTATSYTSVNSFDLPARTIGISKAFVRSTQDNDIEIELAKLTDYLEVSDKTLRGDVRMLAINEDISTSRVFMYPIPDDTTDVIYYLRIRPLHDYVNPGDTSDFPQRWIETIIYGLAERLGHVYSLDLNSLQILENRYRESLRKAKNEDREVTSVDFVQGAFI